MNVLARLAITCAVALLTACSAAPTRSEIPAWVWDGETEVAEAEAESHGFGHRLAWWLPNRIFDVFDIVRARVRLGPGFGISVRATEVADINLAAYTAVWAGIHGPRLEPGIPWPVGVEVLAKAEVSVADAEASPGLGPDYGPFEFGVGFQAAIIGLDVGVEPLEILDLIVGIFTFDLVGDDY